MANRSVITPVLAVIIAVVFAACSYLAPRNRAAGPYAGPEGIRFTYYAPAAVKVQLAGSWPGNNWARGDGSVGEADVGLMTPGKDGTWEIVVPLGPGRYKYLFWVDEVTWHLDPGNPEEVEGGPVGVSSLLVVFVRDGKREVR